MNSRQVSATKKYEIHFAGRRLDHDIDLRTSGFSLVEMLVIIAIVGILAGMGVVSYAGMTRKYNIDNQIRRIHADLSKVRVMALTKGRTHFVTLKEEDGSYEAKDDNNSTVLRSNEALNLSTVTNSQFRPIALNGGAQIDFNSRGLCTTATSVQPQTICIYSNVTPRYDCVNVWPTRIALGKLDAQGVCDANHCKIQ